MNNAAVRLSPVRPLPRQDTRLPLARVLIERGAAAPWQLFYALKCQSVWNASVPEILSARGWAEPSTLLDLQAEAGGFRRVDLQRTPPAQDVRALLDPGFCLRHNVVPWARLGDTTILVTGRPEMIDDLRNKLPAPLQNALFAVDDSDKVEADIALQSRHGLTNRAETRLAGDLSCRTFGMRTPRVRIAFTALLLGVLAICLFVPHIAVGLLSFWTLETLFASVVLRCWAVGWHLHQRHHNRAAPTPLHTKSMPPITALPATLTSGGRRARLPRISVMVPLFHETEIASALVQRLTQLTYPRALLEVVLVLEEKDALTRDTIARTRLPKWIRVIEVPAGSGVTTKPRALNYALDFCRGEIIGIWDAEDAPAHDQLERVAQHFATAAPDVACLQGILDFYNPYTNWMASCFSIEYASWFRLMLPGLSKLGFAIPLGGTTLFLRRGAIEEVGGWDSHNVTEDADLGMRLARHGYRTELINTVTQEEANCRPIAWVRQRSRWLKGYMATYVVHMRRPRQLWQDLGPRQFLGFQLLFLCTLSQFLLAPILWMLWGASFGLTQSFSALISPGWGPIVAIALTLATLSNVVTWWVAISAAKRPRLYPFVLAMIFYFPLATLAAYKGLIEMIVAPFYWDKTSHGKTSEGTSHGVVIKAKTPAPTRLQSG